LIVAKRASPVLACSSLSASTRRQNGDQPEPPRRIGERRHLDRRAHAVPADGFPQFRHRRIVAMQPIPSEVAEVDRGNRDVAQDTSFDLGARQGGRLGQRRVEGPRMFLRGLAGHLRDRRHCSSAGLVERPFA